MNSLNKLVLHPSFRKTINEIRKVNLTLTQNPILDNLNFENLTFPPKGNIKLVEGKGSIDLKAKNGQEIAKKYIFSGYDESKLNYFALEGSAYFTAHSLVLVSKQDYMPVNYLSFYFYTRSKKIIESSSFIKYSEDHAADSNKDYVIDRSDFLNKWAIENSILFIDGPLIGGQMTSYSIDTVEKLHIKGVIPIFFVKNSDSNLVTDNIKELEDQYNSDMHWSYRQLKVGQRTNFFMYIDEYNPKNAKIFCYFKGFSLSPQRIEFHVDTYNKFRKIIEEAMDLVYYLLLVHGEKKNPQIRPIAIAERFARDILRMTDSYNLMKSSGLIPTMNQERFGG